jgi:predicted lipoprotein with Yx(FWY)xxD motif
MKKVLASGLLVALLGACASMGGGGPMGARFEGTTLVNSAGMTLYTFDKDVAGSGKSTCNGPCAVNWPPLSAATATSGSGDWTIVVRDDGSKQWAYKGKPVYLWIKDQKPGDKTGDGVNKVWHVVTR